MKEETAKYIRCRTCGKHIEENQSISKIYCSKECADSFTRCPNCGNFFDAKKKELHNGFCSLECETLYNEDGIIVSDMESTESTRQADFGPSEEQLIEKETEQ